VNVCDQIWTRLAINCIHMLNLGSASGITWRIVDVCSRIGTRLVFNCVCLWNLGSASGVTRRIVEWYPSLIAFASWIWGRIWMRLVIICVHMWNLSSASSVSCRIVDIHGRIWTRLRTVDVHGQIGMRLVTIIICLMNLGSTSSIIWWIVGWDLSLIVFASGIWAAPPV
jgi:hypothetical protein